MKWVSGKLDKTSIHPPKIRERDTCTAQSNLHKSRGRKHQTWKMIYFMSVGYAMFYKYSHNTQIDSVVKSSISLLL